MFINVCEVKAANSQRIVIVETKERKCGIERGAEGQDWQSPWYHS